MMDISAIGPKELINSAMCEEGQWRLVATVSHLAVRSGVEVYCQISLFGTPVTNDCTAPVAHSERFVIHEIANQSTPQCTV